MKFPRSSREHGGAFLNALRALRLAPRKSSSFSDYNFARDLPLPSWYNPHLTDERLRDESGYFLYMPWIPEHGDSIIRPLAAADGPPILPFDLIERKSVMTRRSEILRFARNNPIEYRRMVARRLVEIRPNVAGFIFTFDWAPAMQIVAEVCEQLRIPRILVPHESVFIDETKFYVDYRTGASRPSADLLLVWGALQERIFIGRGVGPERILKVGAPKFDAYVNGKPKLDYGDFCRLFGLSQDKATVLFAAQPLDSQIDTRMARESQRQAVTDLLDVVDEQGMQLLVRMPPSRDDVLGPDLRLALSDRGCAAVDEAGYYLVPPEEAIRHASIVTSINSTMLFEAFLAGKPSVSLKYVEFEQMWEKAGIEAVHARDELAAALARFAAGEWTPSEAGLAWARRELSNGAFDGQAAARIRGILQEIASGERACPPPRGAAERLLCGDPLDVVAIASPPNDLQTHLAPLLSANRVSSSRTLKLERIASAELFLEWGLRPTDGKTHQRQMARALGRPTAILEDGFIRSRDIGLSGEAALSVIVDDLTAYYDATRPSRLETLLEGPTELDAAQRARARTLIDRIVGSKRSKYNHAPTDPVSVGRPGHPKALVIDQRRGDMSVELGQADETTFGRMLDEALSKGPDWDVVVKLHPDATKGGRESYFQNLEPMEEGDRARLVVVRDEVNPYSLLEIADEVFTVTSGMGFEALMAGRKVRCYGMPFYAGWGLTEDVQSCPRRSRRRDVEEIFHAAYLRLSRYYSPGLERRCSLEELLDWFDQA